MDSQYIYDQAENIGRHAAQKTFHLGKQAGKKLAKIAAKKILSTLLVLLKSTAVVWLPLVLILFLALSVHMIVYGMPMEAAEAEDIDKKTMVAAFFGTAEDEEIVSKNERLFDEYKALAETWDDGLTEEQKAQVIVHKFPWSILIATDRVVNDASVWEGKENIAPQPKAVFEALRPRFTWKESTVTTVTVKREYDENGKPYYSKSTDTKKVSLVTSADTFEGHFEYRYEWQTETIFRGEDGSYVTVTQEVLKEVIPPEEYYVPWKKYLADTRGITDEATIDLIQELAIVYDEEYQFNHALVLGMDYSSYPAIEGSNGWVWPTASTRITCPFGPRAYPRPGFHHGIDIGATKRGQSGDSVWSMLDGRVTASGYHNIYGNYVVVEHDNNITSLYAHLHKKLVSRGDVVKKGQTIGLMGSTGFSTGVHLHFEIRKDNKPLDPRYYFPK